MYYGSMGPNGLHYRRFQPVSKPLVGSRLTCTCQALERNIGATAPGGGAAAYCTVPKGDTDREADAVYNTPFTYFDYLQ